MGTTKVKETTYIYTLAHPETGVIRYVGKTNSLNNRLKDHIRKDERTKKSAWVGSLVKSGLLPIMEVLDIVPQSEWQFWEMYWIAQLKAWGHTLYNGDNGGLGSDRLPQEVKDKIAAKFLGKHNVKLETPYAQYDLQGNYIQTFESATKAARAMNNTTGNICRVQGKGLNMSGFLWLKISGEVPLKIPTRFDKNGKIVITEEYRKRLSDNSKGRGLGRKTTDEAKLKMRIARLGKSPANKGIPMPQSQRDLHRSLRTTCKKIRQLTLSGEFVADWDSVKYAALMNKATRAGIAGCANGEHKYSAGFKWEWI